MPHNRLATLFTHFHTSLHNRYSTTHLLVPHTTGLLHYSSISYPPPNNCLTKSFLHHIFPHQTCYNIHTLQIPSFPTATMLTPYFISDPYTIPLFHISLSKQNRHTMIPQHIIPYSATEHVLLHHYINSHFPQPHRRDLLHHSSISHSSASPSAVTAASGVL